MSEAPLSTDERRGRVILWRRPKEELPPRGRPVLCAWNGGSGWLYFVAKYTGRRWLDVIPETLNEEYTTPDFWQPIEEPPHV